MEAIKFIKSSSKLFFFDDIAFNEIKDNFTSKQALYAFIMLNVLTSLINGIIMYSGTSSIQPLYWLIIKTIIGITLINLISIVLSSAILHGIIKLFGSKESYNSTLKFSISALLIPMIILAIVNYIVQIIYIDTETLVFNTKDIVIVSAYSLITLSIIIWNLAILTKSLSKIHEISKSKLIASYALMVLLGIMILGILIGIIYLFL